MNDTTPVRAVIGTAGHVDHGKTTLVAHLTGIDTDRLHEEKKRGISIELGFAWLDVSTEKRFAVVDVPGHEKFVRQMIAGAAGIDVVLLIVASDEGVMPQTLEHLDICQLLGVRCGAIVLTKTDLVDDEWLQLAEEDVLEAVAGTFLEGAPVWRYAAGNEALRDELVQSLTRLVERTTYGAARAHRSSDRPFKLSIDRTFTMRGFGTVVTGTSASGGLKIGQSLTIQPSGKQGRVRGLQRHGESVDAIGPGVRAAINIQGLEVEDICRGDVIVSHAAPLAATSMVDAELVALERLQSPIEDRAKVLVHVGTAQIGATLALLGQTEIEPGQRAWCQLRFEKPVAILPGEPFVIRGFQVLERYGKTLGGGRALAPQRRRHRRNDPVAVELVSALASDQPMDAVVAWVSFRGEEGYADPSQLAQELPFTASQLSAALSEALQEGRLLQHGGRLFGRAIVDRLASLAVSELNAYHAANPAREGMLIPELKTRLRDNFHPELLTLTVEEMLRREAITRRGELLASKGFKARLSKAQQQSMKVMMELLDASELTPPRRQDLPDETGLTEAQADEALDLLLRAQRVVRVNRELYYSASPIETLQHRVKTYLEEHGTMDTAAFKELTGASRKWTIPLNEYFDRIKLTIRVGDVRRLRQ